MVSLDCQLSGTMRCRNCGPPGAPIWRCSLRPFFNVAPWSSRCWCGRGVFSCPIPITSVRSGYFAFCPTPLSTAWRRRRRCWDRSVRRPRLRGLVPIMIDWSDLGQGRNGLFAAVCFRGRGLPLLSWVSTPEELNPSQNRVEEFFIGRLLRHLPTNIRPLLLAGPGLRAGQSDPFGAADAQPHRPSRGLRDPSPGRRGSAER